MPPAGKTRITVSEGGQPEVTFGWDEFRHWLAEGRRSRTAAAADGSLVDALRDAWDEWHDQAGRAALPVDRLLEALAARAQTWMESQ